MSSLNETHVYQRELNEENKTSLSELASRIPPGSTVLDVGIGGGAMGEYLARTKSCVVDGVTYNADEAQAAGSAYRKVCVADLDVARLDTLFAGQGYDFVICADVLEHLRDPASVLSAARALLREGGQLLISVPNAAYLGLIGELLDGEFRYRHEGLLDQTHVRFFTRTSLLRFLAENSWQAHDFDLIERDLADSEFAPSLALLPPAVRSQLLAKPDGLGYQLIVSARPLAAGQQADHAALLAGVCGSTAHYVMELYFATAQGYAETQKIEARPYIGHAVQQVRFALPDQPLSGLRLDPADRPGCITIYDMCLRDAAGEVLWQWDHALPDLDAQRDQIIASPLSLSSHGLALLLLGTDPHFSLDIDAEVLARAAAGCFEVSLSWPMSADYQALAWQSARTLGAATAELHTLRTQHAQASDQVARLRHVDGALSQAQFDLAALREYLASVEQNSRALDAAHRALHAEHVRTRQDLLGLSDALSAAQLDAQRARSARDEIAQHIDAIQNSTVFRATRPLVRAKERLDRLRGRGAANPEGKDSGLKQVAPLASEVDVIVPVYRGLDDTRCCVESVLRAQVRTPYRLVLINDCSPEPEVTEYLRSLPGRDARVLLLENEENLGFVGTVNRGMALDAQHDVLLLNSDAEVANDWLDRIRAAAYRDARTSSVTPLSNNATICSYPRFCQDNDLPAGLDTAMLDQLCAQTNPQQAVEVPTGVGFCMYIRRDSLSAVGLFDVANFGKGYGEENDFCMRAIKAGWHHLLTLDTFVRHAGGVSFGAAKTPREREAVTKLVRLHPNYETLVHAHVAADPARLARLRLDLARIARARLPAILAVTHSRGGGTDRHVRELAQVLDGVALCLSLKPQPDGVTTLEWVGEGEAFKLGFRLPEQFDALIEVLRGLGVAHVHLHHLIGHDPVVWGLAQRLGVRYDYTVHDYYAFCPQISLTGSDERYCGEQGAEQCRGCLQRKPAPGGVGIDAWRSNFRTLLAGARYVLAPSQDAGARVTRYVPDAAVRVVPHKDLAVACPPPAPTAIGARALRVVVIGALSPIKGADVLEAVAQAAAKSGAAVEFHLLGYAYRGLQTQPKARLTVHGAYDEADLDDLLAWLQPDLVWFPAQWPETYSYTLSACLKAGLPVVVPDIGAFVERVAGRAWSWIHPWEASAKAWLEFFVMLREQHFAKGVAPALGAAVAVPGTPFDYRETYMDALVARSVLPGIPDEVLRSHGDLRPQGLAAVSQQARGGVLAAVVRVRRLPIMRGLVRCVPLSWQTRLKMWLLK